MPGGRIRRRPGLPGGRPARTGPDQWQDTQREYESRTSNVQGYFSLVGSSNQTITAASSATLTFSGATLDEVASKGLLSYSAGIFTIGISGLWQLSAKCQWAAPASGADMTLAITLNRQGTVSTIITHIEAGTVTLTCNPNRQYELQRGDQIYLVATNGSAGDVAITGTATLFEGFLVA